ncbi:tetratricopeptide repeat protein [Streptomyces sp. NPDC048636]|uniref:tetratricopeptide repeat protein n=1 Tax=Streptomyces sp. NPDC048636 TaxID=3155762 RepID=UPI00341E06F1
MEPFTGMVLSAVGTVASGALSGAGGEMGRRASESLYGLLSRARSQEDGAATSAADGELRPPTLPVTDAEQRTAALRLAEAARSSPEFADAVAQWAREAAWLAPTAERVVIPGVARPRMLPLTTAAFTDREDVLASVTRLLDGADPRRGAPTIIVLTGPGGIGKTAAAVHCAHALEERFPDGALHVDLAGASAATALAPSEALVRFLERLGVPSAKVPGDEARQGDLYRDCTAGRRMVVVLDNAHSDAQVLPLLPAAQGCLVIVTSRRRLDRLVAETGARHLTLPPLSTTDSVRLLTRIVGQERAAAAGGGVRAVAEGTGGMPLAVCTTGARLAVREHLAWETVARQLSERIRRGEQEGTAMQDAAPGEAGDRADPVRIAHDVAYRELAPRSASFYRAVAVWPWPTLTVRCAAFAAGVGEDEARQLLEDLAGVHLLQEVGEERYRFHDVSRAFARDRAATEDGHGRMAAGVRRVAVGYLRFAAGADFRVMPLRWRLGPAYAGLVLPERREAGDGKRALEELRGERDNLAAVVRAAEQYGFDDLVWQLCESMWGLHLRLGFHESWVDTHLRGVEAARRGAAAFGDPRAVGRILVQLAFAYMGLGRLDDAEGALLEAAAADEACGHPRGQASAVEALGLLRLKRWRYPDAQRCFEDARELLGRIRQGDDGWRDLPRARALLDHHLGRALSRQGRVTEAADRLNGALAQFRALPGGDRYNEGRVYMSLGEAQVEVGDADQARVCLDKAIATMGDEGAALQLADATELRSRCHRLLGQPGREADDLRSAATLYDRGGDHVGLDRVRARLAELAG